MVLVVSRDDREQNRQKEYDHRNGQLGRQRRCMARNVAGCAGRACLGASVMIMVRQYGFAGRFWICAAPHFRATEAKLLQPYRLCPVRLES